MRLVQAPVQLRPAHAHDDRRVRPHPLQALRRNQDPQEGVGRQRGLCLSF